MPASYAHLPAQARLLGAIAETLGRVLDTCNANADAVTLGRTEPIDHALARIQLATPIGDELAKSLALRLETEPLEFEFVERDDDEHGSASSRADELDPEVADAKRAIDASLRAIQVVRLDVQAIGDGLEKLAELAELAASPVDLLELADALGLEHPNRSRSFEDILDAARQLAKQRDGAIAVLTKETDTLAELEEAKAALAEAEGQRDELAARLAALTTPEA